jgi:hypothetical protein
MQSLMKCTKQPRMNSLDAAKISSASAYRRAEDVFVHSIIVAELELGDIQRQVLFADLVERSDASSFDERPEPFDGVGVDGADDVLAPAVIHDAMREAVTKTVVGPEIVSAEKADPRRDPKASAQGENTARRPVSHGGFAISDPVRPPNPGLIQLAATRT